MRLRSQDTLRGFCLVLLVFGAIACGEDPAPPAGQAPAAVVPAWAQDICQRWLRRDGSCDQAALMADFEECQRTQGVPELERLREVRSRTRPRLLAMERARNLCLEQRGWAITEQGRASLLARPRNAAPPS